MLAPGAFLQDRYQIVAVLGHGGMGAVYQATDRRLGQTVAIKQILHTHPLLQDAFIHEAQLLATLRHPALPKVTDYFVELTGQFLVMEFIPGADLATQLAEQRPTRSVDCVLTWADQLLNVLAYLHSRQPPVVHRDIKPHNLKLNEQGAVILLDFGLAKGGINQTQADRSLAGYTLHYAPPEQLRGEPTDARSDLYALAATLYHLLSATKPTDALTRLSAVAAGQPAPLQPLHLLNPAVPPMLADVIHQGLALDPLARFGSADAMRSALIAADGETTNALTSPVALATPLPLNNLPVQLTSFVGRETEIAAVIQLLQAKRVRLLTLMGPGGIGKTRLALAAATEWQGALRDGIGFVSLASIRETQLVLPTIAQALGIREEANTTVLQSLQQHLRDKQLLLVLDNFEQVLDAAPLLSELLMSCANLKVLVTSRALLQVQGEHAFPVPSLVLPDRKQTPKTLAQFATIQLFVQRAQAVNPAFRLTASNAAAVVEICHRLDGLPLAIELAAAYSKILPAPVILVRLAERFELLSSGVRDVPDRQRTLYASISWSYELLDHIEQLLFRRLAVFRGSFNLAAAEALCAAAVAHESSVLATIASLVDKSLLKPYSAVETEPRFVMLETIREFGLKQLTTLGEAAAVQQAHAAYFYNLALQAEPQLWGAEIAVWVQRLDLENDNLRAALTYYMDNADGAEQRLKLAGSLWRFWEIRGHILEGRTWLTKALNQAPDAYPLSRWLTLHGAGNLASDHGDYAVAKGYYSESLLLLQDLLLRLTDADTIRRTRYGLANTVGNLGNIAFLQSDYHEALARSEEALTLHRQLNNKIGMALTINNLAVIALHQSDDARAAALSEESLALYRELGDDRGMGWNLERLGTLARRRGDYDQAAKLYQASWARLEKLANQADMATLFLNLGDLARAQGNSRRAETDYRKGLALAETLGNKRDMAALLDRLSIIAARAGQYAKATTHSEQSIALYRTLGDHFGLSEALYTKGRLADWQQQPTVAAAFYRESLAIKARLKDRNGIGNLLSALAGLAIPLHQQQRATALLAAAANIRQELTIRMDTDAPVADALVEKLRAALDADTFAAAWHAGQTMSLAEAIRYALEEP